MSIALWSGVTTLTMYFILCLRITNLNCSTVMSVDFGSEWMKVATISPGVPIEISPNQRSEWKTPSAIAFHNGERTFGEDALTDGIYFPSNCYIYFLDLLGKQMDNPIVDLYKKRFPYYNIISDPKRNTVLFKNNETDEKFSPEELVAMMLEKAREFAQESVKQVIHETIISVPGYFGQAERYAMLIAAKIAGIKVLQLINSYTAAALNYGLHHIQSFNQISPTYILFYDMGAYSTQASVVSYQLIKSEDNLTSELRPKLTILGVGYERNLGGLEIQLRLRNFLANKFNDLKLTSNDVTKNPQAMSKLFKEAGRLKIILSANTEHFAEINGLIDKKNLLINVTRNELEELCKDLFNKVALPAQRALEASTLTIDLIKQVILVGGGTRVPRVQDCLVKDLKSDNPLGHSLNTDEATVLGAAYKVANVNQEFDVNPFITRDATLFPIEFIFNRDEGDNKPSKQVKHILFSYMNPYPQRKIITFNKHQDLNFTVGYAELIHLVENEVKCLGTLSLINAKLYGVQDSYSKYHNKEDVYIKGIKVQFVINNSGILVLENIELLIENTDPSNHVEETIFSKIISAIGNIFTDIWTSLMEKKNIHEITADTSTVHVTEVKTIDIIYEYLFMLPVEENDLQNLIIKINKLKEKDLEQLHKEKSLHNLLTIVVDAREKLEQPEYSSVATDVEKRSILNKCCEISDWLGYDGLDAEAYVFDSKYDELNNIVMPVWRRAFEHLERPSKLETLNKSLNEISTLLEKIKNTTKEDTPFTKKEIDMSYNLILEITSWRDIQVEKQEKLPKFLDPVLTIQTIELKHAIIQRKMKYLMYKLNSWKSKKIKTNTILKMRKRQISI